MPVVDAPIESRAGASRTPAPKRRNHRKARKPFDGRYAIGRRVKELVDAFRARIGPDADDPITSAAIHRCAETTALAEHLRAKMLRGENVAADDVLRASRTADLLTRRLRLDRRDPQLPSLAEYLRSRAQNGADESASLPGTGTPADINQRISKLANGNRDGA